VRFVTLHWLMTCGTYFGADLSTKVLAPSRDQRIKLELLLSDVWSREVLPFPGMTRPTASSIMRKLSVASITSNFSKRSGSLASLNKAVEDQNEQELINRAASHRSRFVPSLKENHSQESLDRRVTSLKEARQADGHVTPPLQSSSANSVKTEAPSLEKTVKWSKRTKGLRHFFR
jgi:hypothetical protein